MSYECGIRMLYFSVSNPNYLLMCRQSEGPKGFSEFHVYVCAALLDKYNSQILAMDFQVSTSLFSQLMLRKSWCFYKLYLRKNGKKRKTNYYLAKHTCTKIVSQALPPISRNHKPVNTIAKLTICRGIYHIYQFQKYYISFYRYYFVGRGETVWMLARKSVLFASRNNCTLGESSSITNLGFCLISGWRDHIGMNPSALARRIALLNRRWFLAQQAVRLAGNIRPIEDTKLESNAQFYMN